MEKIILKQIYFLSKSSLRQSILIIWRFFDFIIPDLFIFNIPRGFLFKLFWKSGRSFTIAKGNRIQQPGKLKIGERVFINHENLFNNANEITIGNYSLIGFRNLFITENHVEKGKQRVTETGYSKPIKIGDNVWITSNCTILPGTIIENNVILSAGSVAKGKLKSGWIYRGNPAKKVRKTEGVLRG